MMEALKHFGFFFSVFIQEYVKHAKEFVEKNKQWKAFERKESKSPHFPGDKLKELKDLFDDIALRYSTHFSSFTFISLSSSIE